ncbi:MAG TPA: bifunctional precorrin-2 dehydrogenase/sirohydrochlorin ferrochelatase [Acidimicrobiales bacterium]|nr:bifunctional precorrin-2 dehydrogenase/sirohydrochlorin ferrochelatase [Acidimicrobiales bacterium]
MPVDAPVFHAALVLAGKRCLVVGGGQVASRKAAGLLAAQALVHVVATEVREPMRALEGLAGVEERPYRRGEVAGYWLAVAATGDPEANQAVFDDGEAAGIWVNSADDPARCSFILPAVARQGPVSVAVSTGGHSPALASFLRAHVESEMGPELAVLADLLGEMRARLKAQGRSTEDVDWRPALDWAMLDLIRQGRRAEVKERLEACLL